MRDEIKKELKNGTAIEVSLDDAKVEGSIGLIAEKDEYLSFATKKLIEYIRAE